jgi:hypothetical protein
MKKLILGAILLFSVLSFGQEDEKSKIGFHFGVGGINISNDYYNDSKVSFDVGLLYISKSSFLLSADFIFAPSDSYENTGINGSNSTFEKYDADTFLFDAKVGYLIKKRVGLMVGVSIGSISIYEVKRGYSNLTAYELDKKNVTSLSFATIVPITKNFYLGVNGSLGENSYTQGLIGVSF